jgi:hypothetical protein
MDEGFGFREETEVDDQDEKDGQEGDGGIVYLEHICSVQWVDMLRCRMSSGPSLLAELVASACYCVEGVTEMAESRFAEKSLISGELFVILAVVIFPFTCNLSILLASFDRDF